ncbi:protein fantom-like, partial [Festucalex cinctus]
SSSSSSSSSCKRCRGRRHRRLQRDIWERGGHFAPSPAPPEARWCLSACPAHLIRRRVLCSDACEKVREEKRDLERQLADRERELDELRRRDGDGDGGQAGGGRSFPTSPADAELVLELEKVRRLLAVESRISGDLKLELESAQKKMEADEGLHAQQLQVQAQTLAAKDGKMRKLEARLRDAAEDAEDADPPSPLLEEGENLVEVEVAGATLSADALEVLGDPAPATFCTYAFYRFHLHATPLATGPAPRYGFTSRYAVKLDRDFLAYVGRRPLLVEMHQALGLRWKTVASARLDLRRLLRDGDAAGTLPLLGECLPAPPAASHRLVVWLSGNGGGGEGGEGGEGASFGWLEYRLKLRHPVGETERLAAPDARDQQAESEAELLVEVRGCGGLRSRCSALPSPYVVYKLFGFPDHPTATVHDCRQPSFADVRTFRMAADDDELRRYLASRALALYVFDEKEPQADRYLGKAAVPLAPLLRGRRIAGEPSSGARPRPDSASAANAAQRFCFQGTFDLHDSSGCHVGHIDVSLEWKSPFLHSGKAPSPQPLEAAPGRALSESHAEPSEFAGGGVRETPAPAPTPAMKLAGSSDGGREAATAPTSAKKLAGKDEQVAKKVTFREAPPPGPQVAPGKPLQPVQEEEEDDDDDEESLISEGQLLIPHPPLTSDLAEPERRLPPAGGGGALESASGRHAGASSTSDSDDDILRRRASQGSQRVRVEVTWLSLEAESRLRADGNVVRLFVEFNFLDMATEETPVSLPKPPPGSSLAFNFSRVIAVDAAGAAARRQLLKDVLRGRKPDMERIRFTVVSEPPEEEEQERECEDVGVAFLNIPHLLTQTDDVVRVDLPVVDVEDAASRLGSLAVAFEGVRTLRAILDERDDGRPGAPPPP